MIDVLIQNAEIVVEQGTQTLVRPGQVIRKKS